VKALLIAHVLVTIFVVIVTANHFFMDLIGGAIALGLGIALSALRWGALARWVTGPVHRWRRRREEAHEPLAPAIGSFGAGAGQTALAEGQVGADEGPVAASRPTARSGSDP
jgi:hypothetical protein